MAETTLRPEEYSIGHTSKRSLCALQNTLKKKKIQGDCFGESSGKTAIK